MIIKEPKTHNIKKDKETPQLRRSEPVHIGEILPEVMADIRHRMRKGIYNERY